MSCRAVTASRPCPNVFVTRVEADHGRAASSAVMPASVVAVGRVCHGLQRIADRLEAALGEDLVEQGQVVDAGRGRPPRAGRRRSASSADPCSDEAIGSTVNVRFSKAPAIVSSARRLSVIASMPSFVDRRRRGGVGVDRVDRVDEPVEQARDDVGVLLEEAGGDDQVGRDELAVGPQVALVDEHVAAAFEDQPGRPRLGDPGAVELALLEQRERLGVLDVDDVDVAAAGGVGGEAVVGEPGAQGDVLGVAEGGRGERRAGEVVGGVDPVGDDQARPARGGAGDDPQGLTVGLGEAVDRRVGADERGVDRSAKQRLDRLAAGVEVADLQVDVGPERPRRRRRCRRRRSPGRG